MPTLCKRGTPELLNLILGAGAGPSGAAQGLGLSEEEDLAGTWKDSYDELILKLQKCTIDCPHGPGHLCLKTTNQAHVHFTATQHCLAVNERARRHARYAA